jgi:hypothetical protein
MQTNRQPFPRLAAFSPSLLPVLTNGPAKLCQALRIDKKLNNWDVTAEAVWREHEPTLPREMIAIARVSACLCRRIELAPGGYGWGNVSCQK